MSRDPTGRDAERPAPRAALLPEGSCPLAGLPLLATLEGSRGDALAAAARLDAILPVLAREPGPLVRSLPAVLRGGRDRIPGGWRTRVRLAGGRIAVLDESPLRTDATPGETLLDLPGPGLGRTRIATTAVPGPLPGGPEHRARMAAFARIARAALAAALDGPDAAAAGPALADAARWIRHADRHLPQPWSRPPTGGRPHVVAALAVVVAPAESVAEGAPHVLLAPLRAPAEAPDPLAAVRSWAALARAGVAFPEGMRL